MKHGQVPNDFKKLINLKAQEHPNEVFLAMASIMGPADEPNVETPSGWTYFGQFVDHDITFDKGEGINARTPIFDLDSLYGNGPGSQEHSNLYEGDEGKETFIVGNERNPEGDLQRDENFKAMIPDPRNDENIIVASLQLLFQRFHNKLINKEDLSFQDAKKTVLKDYQFVVLNEFLPLIIGKERVESIISNGRKLFIASDLSEVFMPLEFAGACYRFGHSMVRDRYSFNDTFNNSFSNPRLFFDFPGGRPVDGGHQITDIWTLQGNGNTLMRFFDPTILRPLVDADNFAGKIDTKLPPVLFNLEVAPRENNILAHRNLISGQRFELPNGQQVATALIDLGIEVTRLSQEDILENEAPSAIANNTPLWYYILKEAEKQHSGKHLGDVGGTIVGETIIGLLQADPNSIMNDNSESPFNIPTDEEKLSIKDIIKYVS
ncbi:peroxidase family protein [Limibacter armeniacum]|uniref:peroxidase family protein n=1 Tax=Limibacter armeniacum TaxID=466084 RepID=UPI002FE6B01A